MQIVLSGSISMLAQLSLSLAQLSPSLSVYISNFWFYPDSPADDSWVLFKNIYIPEHGESKTFPHESPLKSPETPLKPP